jgi:hypothetical protein
VDSYKRSGEYETKRSKRQEHRRIGDHEAKPGWNETQNLLDS